MREGEGRQFGRYTLLEELGKGGFATVYKARDTVLGRFVALKVLKPYWAEEPDFVSRFQQEARASAMLRHPHIVTIYDTGETAGHLFIAMEYLDGQTLDQLLAEKGPLSLDATLHIISQIAAALDHAHAQGMVHRDVKPSNIIVEENTWGQTARLLDFGLVKAMEHSAAVTSSGTLLGTPAYMSPEQVEGAGELDGRSDLYALGVVLYEMLTGRPPFEADTPTRQMFKHVHEPVPDILAARPALPPTCRQLIQRALAKAPADRYQTGQDLAHALAGLNAPRPTPVPPVISPRNVPPSNNRPNTPPVRRLPETEREEKRSKLLWFGGATTAVVLMLLLWAVGREPPSSPVPPPAPTPTTEPPVAEAIQCDSGGCAGDRHVRALDGMELAYVPGGSFRMGSGKEDDEAPIREVTLDPFWIDLREVTNAQFEIFVAATGHTTSAEENAASYRFVGYDEDWERVAGADWRHPAGDGSELTVQRQAPVTHVSWVDANAYCRWVGGRLPSEAEWEYAARGPLTNTYPWGNSFSAEKLNSCGLECGFDWHSNLGGDGYEHIAPVGSYPDGASWIGALDMAGNVYEWMKDWYQADYYAEQENLNPQGPADMSGDPLKVVRGGAWFDDSFHVRSADRFRWNFRLANDSIGFRCVQDSVAFCDAGGCAGDERLREPDAMPMAYVPGGSFPMGSNDGFASESPLHSVTLDSFWIDQAEVTNAQFADFVETTAYRTTAEELGSSQLFADERWEAIAGAYWYHPNGPDAADALSADPDHPVIHVSWDDAGAYCSWAGGRLPTEAEWEYAARGPAGKLYPWGDTFVGENLNHCDTNCASGEQANNAVADDGFAALAPVRSYSAGRSWIGAYDMAGNAAEWVNDWYAEDYYQSSPAINPGGPETTGNKVVRGGSWLVPRPDQLRSSARGAIYPTFTDNTIGFRCVQD